MNSRTKVGRCLGSLYLGPECRGPDVPSGRKGVLQNYIRHSVRMYEKRHCSLFGQTPTTSLMGKSIWCWHLWGSALLEQMGRYSCGYARISMSRAGNSAGRLSEIRSMRPSCCRETAVHLHFADDPSLLPRSFVGGAQTPRTVERRDGDWRARDWATASVPKGRRVKDQSSAAGAPRASA
jgi:hypothetical protein